jgi:putative ABC transport system ATP-binding protein
LFNERRHPSCRRQDFNPGGERASVLVCEYAPCRLSREDRLVLSPLSPYTGAVPLLELFELKKSFRAPDGSIHKVIDVPKFALEEKAHAALRGESGLGKTTLLHLIAGILRADSGRITLAGQQVTALSEPARDRLRARTVGYIFQSFNLLLGLTCLENVLLGMSFGLGVDRRRAEELLRRVGLGDRMHHRPRQLSVGQQQRVAVARALANRPKLVLADEPTGNLDAANAHEALRLIHQTCTENGAALLLVSHDREVLSQFHTVLELSQLNRAAGATEARA